MKREKTIHTEEYVKIVDLLSAERKRLGLSQSEIADIIGMTQSDISKIENFERRLDVLEFKLILVAYRVNENPILAKQVRKYLQI